jgi:hypothetical protein
MAPDDVPPLTTELAALGVEVEVLPSRETTAFVNEYASENPDGRRQWLQSRATPFEPGDVSGEADAYVFGPLKSGDCGLRSTLDDCESERVRGAGCFGSHVGT